MDHINITYLHHTTATVLNDSQINMTGMEENFSDPFNYPWVKMMFICLYTIVFLVCCIGNSLVLYTIARNKRMRTRTIFFLANLAVADLGVGIVCVLPKLSTFLSPTWLLGEAMCKISFFAHSMTNTASILLLTAIAVERYFAIIHPLRSRCLVTQNRLIFAQIFIWVLSAGYNAPELSMFSTISITRNGTTDTFCFPTNPFPNMREFFTVNFILWYAVPLCIMTFMYFRVCCTLWRSSKMADSNSSLQLRALSCRSRMGMRQEETATVLCYDASLSRVHSKKVSRNGTGEGLVHRDSMRQGQVSENNYAAIAMFLCCGHDKMRSKDRSTSQRVEENHSQANWSDYHVCGHGVRYSNSSRNDRHQQEASTPTHKCNHAIGNFNCHQTPPARHTKRKCHYVDCGFVSDVSEQTSSAEEYDMTKAPTSVKRRGRCQYKVISERVLTSRCRIIRLLVVVLITFAVCVFPHHLKLLLMYWSIYPGEDTAYDLLSPIAFIMLYTNSALNPILYWVFSDTFRRSLKECCRRRITFRPDMQQHN